MSSPLVIKSLSLEHFALYQERQRLPLAGLGLVLVQGLNLRSAALDANGVGKTSLLNALAFCLFGKRLDGRRGDAVACRFTDGQALAVVELEDERGPWMITRGARPKLLRAEGFRDLPADADDATVQAAVESRLGFGHRTFCNAVVFSQGDFNRFIAAGQDEQMRMLDEIQGVDLRAPLERAKEWRAWLTGKLEALEYEIRDLEARRNLLRGQQVALADAEARFSATKAADLARAGAGLATAEQELAHARRRLPALRGARERVQAWRAAWGAAQDSLKAALEARQALREAAGLRTVAVQALAEHEAAMARLREQERCPTCRGDIKSARARQRVERDFRPDREALQAATARAESECRRVAKDLEQLERAHASAAGRVPRDCVSERWIAEREAEVNEAAERALLEAVSALEARCAAAREAVAAVEERRWDGAGASAGVEEELRAADTALGRALPDLDHKTRLRRVAEYWVEAFGDRGLRSLLFESVQPFLAARVAAHLQVLTGGEARMDISATRQNKSGTVRERLTFRPVWAWGADGEGSRGQDRRMDLALFAALQDLAEFQSARAFPLKAWDEPGDALDGLGRDIFVGWLAREARARGTGFFITHSHEAAATADADAVWTVVLDAEGVARVEFQDVIRAGR